MKYIATTNFSQGNQNILNTPDGGMQIERGRVIELPFDLPITKLPKDDYLKYSVFFGQQPMLVLLDTDQGRQILKEVKVQEEKARKKRDEATKDNRKWDQKPVGTVTLIVIGGLILAGLIAFISYLWHSHHDR
jgi:hypothetical protein